MGSRNPRQTEMAENETFVGGPRLLVTKPRPDLGPMSRPVGLRGLASDRRKAQAACGPPGMNGSGHHPVLEADRKSTRLNSSHPSISYAVFCLKKKIEP